MIKAKYLAKDYMYKYIEENKICKKEEVEEVIRQYDKINNLGIPAINYMLMFNCFSKVLVYILLIIFLKLF